MNQSVFSVRNARTAFGMGLSPASQRLIVRSSRKRISVAKRRADKPDASIAFANSARSAFDMKINCLKMPAIVSQALPQSDEVALTQEVIGFGAGEYLVTIDAGTEQRFGRHCWAEAGDNWLLRFDLLTVGAAGARMVGVPTHCVNFLHRARHNWLLNQVGRDCPDTRKIGPMPVRVKALGQLVNQPFVA